MGDFDRQQAPVKGKDQTKQVAFVIVLGVVLIGVVGAHMMKKGPQAAMGAESDGAIPLPVSDETPDHARDSLAVVPYRGVLEGSLTPEPVFITSPRNPFVMATDWYVDIAPKPKPVDPQPGQVVQVSVRPDIGARITPQPVKLDNYKLGSIIRQNDKYMAIINGQIVSAGALLDGARVVEILADRVVLQHPDFPTGPKSDLMMERKLNK